MTCFAHASRLSLLTIFGSAIAYAATGAGASTIESAGVPAGFGELARDHDQLVDVYYGGHRIAEARVVVSPGHLRFREPQQLLQGVPNVTDANDELANAFAADFATNTRLICSDEFTKACGTLAPDVAGIIYDQDHFRVDLFVNPRFLEVVRPKGNLYLPTPTAPLSLASASGLAVSGSNGASPIYNLQNRTVIGLRDARVRIESSYASRFGFLADSAVAELDRPGMRYSAGLFWAPGLDLTGQRRIMGVGFGSQIDTRTDRDILSGTPLVLFLSRPARVDILIDGRLVRSGTYEAGNNMLDTSSLPDGSYTVVLRVHEQDGVERSERRFFTKNPQIAPVGKPIYFGYAGLLANSRRGMPVSLSGEVFYQLGTARRLSEKIALDVSIIGASKAPIVEAGGWLILPLARVRAAGLASADGDGGGLIQVNSQRLGSFSVNLDLRHIWTGDDKPLLPISPYVETFDSIPLDQQQLGRGSFTQASGSIGYHVGSAYVSVVGSLRKDRGLPTDYSIGPNLSWPLVSRNGLQIAFQADAQRTRMTTAGYAGVTMMFNRGRYSVSSAIGGRTLSNAEGVSQSKSRSVGDTTIHYSYADDRGNDLSASAGLTRELDASTAHAQGVFYSRLGSVQGQVLRSLEGSNRTQYGLTLQTGAVLNGEGAVLGGRDLTESAVVISVDGDTDAQFDVLIDGQPRGRIRGASRMAIFLLPYRSYSVRLKAVDAPSLWYDTASREFTLYPGNVPSLQWHAEQIATIFGRAVRQSGEPVANAMITAHRAVGQTNSDGYFQIDAASNDIISFEADGRAPCKIQVPSLSAHMDHARLGKVLCQ